MSKFILNIYQLRINQFVSTKLADDGKDDYKYLKTLHYLYLRIMKLSSDMSEFIKDSNDDLLAKLTQNMFAKHLANYIDIELRCFDSICSMEVKKFYDSKNHQKKQTERFQDLKRDMQAIISARTNINIVQIDNYGGETFLSEELAINLLQESAAAFERCSVVSYNSLKSLCHQCNFLFYSSRKKQTRPQTSSKLQTFSSNIFSLSTVTTQLISEFNQFPLPTQSLRPKFTFSILFKRQTRSFTCLKRLTTPASCPMSFPRQSTVTACTRRDSAWTLSKISSITAWTDRSLLFAIGLKYFCKMSRRRPITSQSLISILLPRHPALPSANTSTAA
jgi:hypothetical protein